MAPLHILIVDDEQVVCETLSDYLCDLGHQVTVAHCGTTALRTLSEHEFDLALVDLRMPGMDGMALLERFQQVLPAVLHRLMEADFYLRGSDANEPYRLAV